MNYSDYDSDGYSSNEDADYVPSDGSLSEDDINECEKEDPLHEDEEVPHPGSVHKSKKKKKDKNLSRKRKKGIFKVENADKDQVEETNQPPNEEPPAQLQQEEDEAKQKKKSDDLWASFLFDVGSRPKLSTAATDSDTTSKRDTQTSTVKVASPKAETKPSEPAKVTITKVFDFAGEEVRVNEEVAADSQEARRFLKSQSSPQENKETEEECSSPSPSSVTVSSGVKRPAGLSKILGRIGGKKQKMSTLEKSKMDWDAFKSEEGISEELAIHNRGREGYVERKNFLERVDHRQFEIEKTVRLSNMKR
ncbi:craniofacial development protein 1 [Periophthalmus magnuspinnatus]|uniref:craniofacial development protein 1 n=1 Tax=Periophthalmus magnuspinnatus TaxID=409849 RepID=UPI00145B51E2|nr:craniofacial development protein 1 [Periophthalmus magnuspinnatus]